MDTSGSSTSSQAQSWLEKHWREEESDGTTWRFCKFWPCQQKFRKSTGHSNLVKHVSKYHEGHKAGQISLDKEDHIDKLVKYIVVDKRPFRSIETPRFRAFAYSMNPNKKLPDADGVSSIIRNKTPLVRQLVVKQLEEAEAVSLTFDFWTSKLRQESYSGVTAHYLTHDFKPKSLVIEFDEVPHPHTGHVIAKLLKDVITRYHLKTKIVAITTDNASNNISGIENELQETLAPTKFIHFRCLAHVINLAVGAALEQLDTLVQPFKDIVQKIRTSPSRSRAFKQIAADLQNDDNVALSLIDNCPTRWNSTFAMLARVLELREPIEEALEAIEGLPDVEEVNWQQLMRLIEFLEPFHEITEELSGEKYPTISLVSVVLPKLSIHCHSYYTFEDMAGAAKAFSDKLDDYLPLLDQKEVLAAALLDPRIKLSFLEDEQQGKNILRSLIGDSMHRSTTQAPRKRRKILEEFMVTNVYDEVDVYTQDSKLGIDDSPLEFWCQNQNKLPKLAMLVKRLYCIQATSVPSERLFSIAGRIDEKRRNRLAIESFLSCVLLQSWLNFFGDEPIVSQDIENYNSSSLDQEFDWSQDLD